MSKSKSNFQNFLPQSAWGLENFEKFQGNWSLFGNFLKNVPKKVKFCQLFAKIIRCTKKNLRKNFKKSASVSDFKHFCHFQTPFYLGLCQYTKVKPWKIWFSKEISKFYRLFGKIQGFEAFCFLFRFFGGKKQAFFLKVLLQKAHFRFL